MAGKELQLIAVGWINQAFVKDLEEPIRSVLATSVEKKK